MRQSGNSLAKKGDHLSCCLSCSTTSTASRKQRRVESNSNQPAKQLTTQPHVSPSQFMEALAESASTAEINGSWRVSVDGMTLPDKGVADHLASLAWEATGYRFRWAVQLIRITLHSYQCSNPHLVLCPQIQLRMSYLVDSVIISLNLDFSLTLLLFPLSTHHLEVYSNFCLVHRYPLQQQYLSVISHSSCITIIYKQLT